MLIGVIAVIWVGLALATPAFLTAGSIRPLLVATAPIALIGVGMTIIIITGGIDVSVGGAIMVCSVLTAKALVAEVSLVPAVLLSVAVGGVLGLLNGVLIAYGRVHAIIITFGTANLFLFLGLQIFGSSTVNGIPQTFEFFGRGAAGQTLGVPNAFLITAVRHRDRLVVPAAHRGWPALLRHRRRRPRRAPGRGEGAAPQLLAYLVTGLLVGLASCFVIAQGTSTLDQSVGSGKELAVIAAVVIGGTSIMGGRGSVLGTFLGALLVQSVTSGRHAARLEVAAVGPVRRDLHHHRGGHGPAARARSEDGMTATATPAAPGAAAGDRAGRREHSARGSCGPCSPSASRCWPC